MIFIAKSTKLSVWGMVLMNNRSKRFIAILLSLILMYAITVNAETVKEALGDNAYLLAMVTENGDVYANSFDRTYNPTIGRWGTKTGTTSNGTAIIELDKWSIADVLGSNYSLLAYTPDRGNCYVNPEHYTYTPGSNQYGVHSGYSSDGRAIIDVIGTIYTEDTYYITRTITYGVPTDGGTVSSAPATQPVPTVTFTPTPTPTGEMVYVYPNQGKKYHSRPHNGDDYDRIPIEQALRDNYTRCEVCW